jgi:quinol monooxygenase YgiN
MSNTAVSIHPYFKANPGQMAAIRELLPRFVSQTASEPGMLYYEFTSSGDDIFCREAYEGAEGALAHLSNVGELLGEMLKLTTITRLEFHGPAAEIEKLKGPLAHLNPTWFIRECGVER